MDQTGLMVAEMCENSREALPTVHCKSALPAGHKISEPATTTTIAVKLKKYMIKKSAAVHCDNVFLFLLRNPQNLIPNRQLHTSWDKVKNI